MSAPLEIFCCYAREDQEMLASLKNHLTPLQRRDRIKIWSDTNLSAGIEWEKELHRHLESADIILLLISSDFIASDYCYSIEMKHAIKRHEQGSACVIPILLRPVYLEDVPFTKLQMLPTNATPITQWPNLDDAFRDVTQHVSRVVHEIQQRPQPIVFPPPPIVTPPLPEPEKFVSPPISKAKQLVDEGDNFYLQDDYDNALVAYRGSLNVNPEPAVRSAALHGLGKLFVAWRDQGYGFMKSKQYQKALERYGKALSVRADAETYTYQGTILKELTFERQQRERTGQDYEPALEAYQQAIKCDPNYTSAYVCLGQTLEWLKRYDEALIAFAKAIDHDSQDADAYHGQGRMLIQVENNLEGGLTAYNDALNLNPSPDLREAIYIDKGNVLRLLDHFKDARAAYEQALDLNPASKKAHEGFGDLWSIWGDRLKKQDQRVACYQAALAEYEKATLLGYDTSELWIKRGNVLKKLGRASEARQAFDKARRQESN